MGKSYENMTVVELKEKLRNKNLSVTGNKEELISRLREKGSRKKSKKENTPDDVVDKDLYIKIRNKVKNRVKVWPSAYASGQVVSEYKKAGGRYKGKKESKDTPLGRWYKEKWVNVCEPKENGYAKCGRSKSKVSNYPYCRPSVRVSSKTPVTVGELKKKHGKQKLEELCNKKRKKGLPKKGRPQRINPKETHNI